MASKANKSRNNAKHILPSHMTKNMLCHWLTACGGCPWGTKIGPVGFHMGVLLTGIPTATFSHILSFGTAFAFVEN